MAKRKKKAAAKKKSPAKKTAKKKDSDAKADDSKPDETKPANKTHGDEVAQEVAKKGSTRQPDHWPEYDAHNKVTCPFCSAKCSGATVNDGNERYLDGDEEKPNPRYFPYGRIRYAQDCPNEDCDYLKEFGEVYVCKYDITGEILPRNWTEDNAEKRKDEPELATSS